MQNRKQFYIDGDWLAPDGANSIDVHSASTGEIIGCVPEGSALDAGRAVSAARAAFADWSQTSPVERAQFLRGIHEGLKARAEEIAHTITAEVGTPIKISRRIQAGSPIAQFAGYARLLDTFEFEKKLGNSLVIKEAAGVAACITPWNYPLHQIAAKVAPALAAGCTVVLKPSEVAPINAFILAEIIHEAGLPKGVFNLLTGYGQVLGESLVNHPDVDRVSFTGSTAAGKRVAQLASAGVKRVSLELGGKSAAILLDDADFPMAVKSVVNSCFLNAGQTCTAQTRMLVPASRYAEAAGLAVNCAQGFTVGDPFLETTKMGPLISEVQRGRVLEYIRDGMASGAELLCGGPELPAQLPRGFYVSPTVFGRVDPASRLAQEEVFGPVLSIITYRDGDEDDAIRIANDSLYGLSGAVWSASDQRATRVARKMRTGQVDINGGAFNFSAPFGGYKQSGIGREMGAYGLDEFLELKSLQFTAGER